ncbi:MAG: hypothetical protein RIQ33_1856 [Bacteroidota bacterium]|jgi:outer membrane protein TolC
MKKIILSFILFYISPTISTAQTDDKVLPLDTFLHWVILNHPIAIQANLNVKIAAAEILAARGSFDPTLSFNNDSKKLSGVNYYNYANADLSIPTWFGVKLNGGFENNLGNQISNELTPKASTYAGVSVPLLKDLLFDKRRAALKQALIFKNQSEWDKKNTLNNLYTDAYIAYLNWVKEYLIYGLLTRVNATNSNRFKFTKKLFESGDKSAIDTIEGLTQLQNFELLLNESKLRLVKQYYELSNFLWLNNQPIYLKDKIVPDTTVLSNLNFTIDTAQFFSQFEQHPKIQSLNSKINWIKTEQKLKFQSLLPQVNVKYNFLQKGYYPSDFNQNQFLQNNYKYGISVSIPIPNRNAFAQYNMSKLKVEITKTEQQYQLTMLKNKASYYVSEIENINKQIYATSKLGANYKLLLDTEEMKFHLGETSLFLLNNREIKWLESIIKLTELKSKILVSIISLKNYSNQIKVAQ